MRLPLGTLDALVEHENGYPPMGKEALCLTMLSAGSQGAETPPPGAEIVEPKGKSALRQKDLV